jgi:hypothetical protein
MTRWLRKWKAKHLNWGMMTIGRHIKDDVGKGMFMQIL